MRSFQKVLIGVGILVLIPWSLPAFVGVTEPLRMALEQAGPTDWIPVNLILWEQVDYQALRQNLQGVPKTVRKRTVWEVAKENADRSQAPILAFLRDQEKQGNVRKILRLIAVNGISFEAKPAVIEALWQRFPQIRSLDLNEPRPLEEVADWGIKAPEPIEPRSIQAPPPVPDQVAWGVERIGAPGVWDMGYHGEGVVIANIDTGVNYTHTDLRDHIWQNLGEDANDNGRTFYENTGTLDPGDLNGVDDDGNGFVDDLIGWDFASNDHDPMDGHGHGTNTAGIMVGDGTGGLHTGVAPEAHLMVLRASGNNTTEATIWAASDYAILMGADVISSSLSWKWPWEPDYASWRQQAEAELAAGIIRANSIGNQGDDLSTYPIPYNIATPGNVPPPWLHPDQTLRGGLASTMGCGAVDQNDVIKYYSGRGPAAWEDITQWPPGYPTYPHPNPPEYWDYPYHQGQEMGLLKPDVAAPTDVPTTANASSGYEQGFSGTSAATPHVGGSMALLLSIRPDLLTPEIISQALQETALDLGAPGKDNLYGAGRIRVDSAAVWILTHLGDSLDPMPPESLTAYSDYLTPTSIELQWSDPQFYFGGDPLGNNLAGIILYLVSDTDTVAIDTVDPGLEHYTHTGLTDGQLYTYALRSFDVYDSLSPLSRTVSWYAGGSPYPAPPSNLDVVILDDSTLALSWDDPTTQSDGTPLDDLLGIYVYANDVRVDSVAPGIETDTLRVTPGQVRVYVTAYDNEIPRHESDPSNVVTVITNVHRGGPDGYGYIYVDSYYTGPGAPTFEWIDASGGQLLIMSDDDYEIVALPFAFPYYGNSFNVINVCSNGFLESSTATNYSNQPLPYGSILNLIAGFWDDLNPSSGGQIYYLGTDSMAVFMWQNVPHFPSSGSYTFEIILYPDGRIKYQYLSISDGTSATVGIQGGTGANDYYLQYTYNGNPLVITDSLAILFSLGYEVEESAQAPLTFAFPPPLYRPGMGYLLRFQLPSRTPVELNLYDVRGRKVTTLFRGILPAGNHRLTWKGRTNSGEALPSGLYFARLTAGPYRATRKLLFVR